MEHADVNEVAQIVRDVYKEELTSSSRSSGRGNSQGANPFAMLMGGGGGGSSRGSSSRGGSSKGGVKMTIGVDSRTSALVVSASDALFKQVGALVSTLDNAAKDAKRTVRIVTLENTNSSAIQQAVSPFVPQRAPVSARVVGRAVRLDSGRVAAPSSRTSSRGGSSSDQAARMRQFMQMRGGSMGRGGSTGRGARGTWWITLWRIRWPNGQFRTWIEWWQILWPRFESRPVTAMDIESVLQHRGLVTEDQWRDARAQAGGRRIDSVLVEMGLLSEEQALEAFADELGMEFIELGDFEVDTELVGQFPTAAIFRHEVLPLDRDNGSVGLRPVTPLTWKR
ncbi:MAG: hypothetical protein CM1200mP2_57780 [Planctomycetaceae bacterium]|nr:MAG: hypothetical protein CM1200mP2_57780 [Planctomycetaceae bacterium]